MEKILGYGSIFGLATVGMYRFMTLKVFDEEAPVIKPPYTSIVMCSLNEEKFIEKALKSIQNQNIIRKYPEKFEFLLIDSHSEDRTVEIAEKYGWKVIEAPRGKLTARHKGFEEAKGEIVISVDCDTSYPPNYANLVLRWFKQPDVVAVVTPRLVDPEENVFAAGLSVWMSLADVGPLLLGGMRAPGQGIALYRQAYFDVGGFNLNIDQLNVHEMVREEEICFAAKLRRLGKVPVEWQAPCFTSLRRVTVIGLLKGKGYKEYTEERMKGKRF